MWKLTEWGKSRLGLPGVPWRDLTDSEYAEARVLYPGIDERGYFERAEDVLIATPFWPGEQTDDEDAAAPEEVVGGRQRRARRQEGD